MRNWIPNQHGAWAFLITPILVAAVIAQAAPMQQLLLLIGWLAAYCFSFYFGLTVKGWRRPDRFSRYRAQQFTYGLVAAGSAAVLATLHPQLQIGRAHV